MQHLKAHFSVLLKWVLDSDKWIIMRTNYHNWVIIDHTMQTPEVEWGSEWLTHETGKSLISANEHKGQMWSYSENNLKSSQVSMTSNRSWKGLRKSRKNKDYWSPFCKVCVCLAWNGQNNWGTAAWLECPRKHHQGFGFGRKGQAGGNRDRFYCNQ